MKIRNAFLMLAPLVLGISAPVSASDTRPTVSFRNEHAQVKEHLQHIEKMAGSLAKQDAAERKKTADFIVQFLNEHIRSHAEWEEKHLYPAVDKRTHADQYPFTGSMRYEHRIIGRSIDELKAAASKADFDATRFTRDVDRLLGLIGAHFEEEEEVLLPILDKTTTREALEKELGLKQGHH